MDSLQNSDDLNHERVAKLAYKYSQQKRFASCSTEENWRQAEKQLGYSRHDHIPFIQGLADRLQSLSELTARFLTILGGLYIIAVALGAVLLIAYLREIGAPTPPIDTAMTVFLLFLAIVFVSLFSVFVLVLLIPFIAKHIDSSLADVYPSLFYTRPLTNGDGQDYWRDYLKFFLPFFSSLIGMAAVIPLYLGHYADWISSTVIWGALITGTVIEFHYLRRLQKYKNLKILPRRRNLWAKASVRDGCRRGTSGAFCRWNQQGRMPRSSLAVSAARRVRTSVM